MSHQELTAYHRAGPNGQPVTEIYGAPWPGCALTPTELRHLARQLNTIANDADQGATGIIIHQCDEAHA